jgi:hypothetical protein
MFVHESNAIVMVSCLKGHTQLGQLIYVETDADHLDIAALDDYKQARGTQRVPSAKDRQTRSEGHTTHDHDCQYTLTSDLARFFTRLPRKTARTEPP